MLEAQNDNGKVVTLATYPKQPFNFSGRTGVVAFDVSADSQGSHAAWPEFWITNKPVPAIRGSVSAVPPPIPEHGFGFSIDGGCNDDASTTGVGRFFVSRNFVYDEPSYRIVDCVKKSTATSPSLNHFEVRISQNRAEVWGTDPGSDDLKQLAVADNLDLTFTQGLVWLNDTHYNASKGGDGSQTSHTFAWDNLGFDGPKTYRDLSFDVRDANASTGGGLVSLGYAVGTGPVTLTTESVFRRQAPTGALLTLNFYSFDTVVPTVRINGGPPITTPWPFDGSGYFWRTIAIPVPVDQVADGPNTITFTTTGQASAVSNVNIILVAAAPVP